MELQPLRKVRRIRLAATANVTIATGLIPGEEIDGVELVKGDEVLLPYQTTGSQNGPWIVKSIPERAYAGDTNEALRTTDFEILQGDTNAGATFRSTLSADDVIDTNTIRFARIDGRGMSVIATTGGTTVLTDAQASNKVLKFTGVKGSNAVIEVPAVPAGRTWLIHNTTTGAFTLTVKVNGGTGIVVANAKNAWVFSDGVDVLRAGSDV